MAKSTTATKAAKAAKVAGKSAKKSNAQATANATANANDKSVAAKDKKTKAQKAQTVTAVATVEHPVKFFWGTIGDVVASGITTRKGVIEHFVNKGLNFYTARTQYQIWFSMQKK